MNRLKKVGAPLFGLFLLGAAPSAPAAPGAEGPAWRQLRAPAASASSYLKSNWNKYEENYHPNYVLDGDPRTAWVEGDAGDGVGATLSIPLSTLSSARAIKLRVRNGYQKSEALLLANGAPSAVTATVTRHGAPVASLPLTLSATMGWQEFTLPVPAGASIDGVELRLESVRAGKTYKDTCISDVELWSDSDVPYAAAVEAAKHAAVVGWIGERVAAARYFAALPPSWPYAGTDLQWRDLPTRSEAAFEAAAGPLRAAASAVLAQGPRYKPAFQTTWRDPDGVYEPALLSSFLLSANVSFFETDKEVVKDLRTTDDEYAREDALRDLHVEWAGADQRTAAGVAYRHRSVWDERTLTTRNREVYLQYDAQGRLARWWTLANEQEGSGRCGATRAATVGVVVWSAAGKVEGLESVERYMNHRYDDAAGDCAAAWTTELRVQAGAFR
jgi:hypothetical protein